MDVAGINATVHLPWTQATKDRDTKPEYGDVYINTYTYTCL